MNALRCLLPLLAPGAMSAQELLWEVHSQSVIAMHECVTDCGDWNKDGAKDAIVLGYDDLNPFQPRVLRVLSGLDGTIIDEWYPPFWSMYSWTSVGDFDRDGYTDIAFVSGVPFVEVWSIARRGRLFQIPVVSGAHGGALCGDLDCDGDGAMDIVHVNGPGVLIVSNHFGGTIYTIPTLALGLDAFDVDSVGDLDGDGRDDFLVAGREAFSGMGLGAAVLFSGATGTPLRVHFGSQPFGLINRQIRRTGDVDGDGVGDYACGNADAPYGLIMIWSGATGALLREWFVPVGYLFGHYIAGHDVDLDGTPDIIDFAPTHPNPPSVGLGWAGRVRTLSTRDGQDLVQLASQEYITATLGFGYYYADLGVQPGNPYPVFLLFDSPLWAPNLFGRIRAYRTSPKGTQFVGQGCSSSGKVPTIGIRRVDATPNDASRLVLGYAPPDSLAICVVAPANVTSANGITTPFGLDPLGLTGCQLLVPDVLHHVAFTGSTGMDRGYAAFDFPRTMAATGGTLFAAQWLVLDPSTPGYATTARYEFRLQ